jgi:hypothetical protein
VRLVLQPVYDQGGELAAEDGAVHLFYDLPVGDFVALVGDLLDAQQAAAPLGMSAPLDVHPTLSAEGLSGPYGTRIRDALLRAIGERRLTRMTFVALGAGHDTWTFGGFDLDHGTATPLEILDPTTTAQIFSEDVVSDPLAFSATVQPPLHGAPEDLSPLYDSPSAAALDDATLWSLYERALRIENPKYYSPASVDCVSCHTAQPARLWLERNTTFAGRASELRYQADFELGVTEQLDETNALRAFGFVGARPSINARVVNESAAIAGYLNRQLLGH